MHALILSLSLILQPLAPATEIYLGELVRPIRAIKLKLNELAPSDGAFITRDDWIRAKVAIEGTRPLCEFVANEALSACLSGIEREREISAQRDSDQKHLIDALKTELSRETERASNAERSSRRFMFATISLGVVATVSASLLYFCAGGK